MDENGPRQGILAQSTPIPSDEARIMLEGEATAITPKEYLFASLYLQSFNHRLAAEKCGYSPQHGYALLKSTKIAAIIEKSLKQAVMSPDEVLARLSAQASADMGDVFDIDASGYPRLNLKKCLDSGRMHLIKSLSFDARGMPRVELHDAQSALVAMGKVYALFIDRREDTVNIRETLDVRASVQLAINNPTLLRQMMELAERMGATIGGVNARQNAPETSAEGAPRLPTVENGQEG